MSTEAKQLDHLTGLATRKAFEEELKASILRATQSDLPLSLAFVDIDQFKYLNDSLGHAYGDSVIKAIANTINEMCKTHAKVFRYGGDELALILPDTEREQAFLFVEKIRNAVDAMESLYDGKNSIKAHVTISAGISAIPIDAQDENELLRKADQAIYKAKATGRNKIVLAFEEKMAPKTSHYTQTQLERLSDLAKEQGVGEAVLLREALDNLLVKYNHAFTSRKL